MIAPTGRRIGWTRRGATPQQGFDFASASRLTEAAWYRGEATISRPTGTSAGAARVPRLNSVCPLTLTPYSRPLKWWTGPDWLPAASDFMSPGPSPLTGGLAACRTRLVRRVLEPHSRSCMDRHAAGP